MLEVHNTGRSVVWTGGREQAEVYVQKLQGHHLLASLEPTASG
jgi:ATP-dependent Clp protease adapter protein ClpS